MSDKKPASRGIRPRDAASLVLIDTREDEDNR